MGVLQTPLLCVQFFVQLVDYNYDKFIIAPTYTHNKVVWILELVGIVEH